MDPFLEGLRVLVGGGADPVGEVEHRSDGELRPREQGPFRLLGRR
jgi:hypothetical protein